MKLQILTNDPSLTAWGWAVVIDGTIKDYGCIKTQPEHKKKRIRKSDDTARRIQEINRVLLELIQKYEINYVLSEAPHGSQNASAAVMVGITTGIIQTISDCKNIPVEWYSEEDAKKCVIGKKSVSKTEMVNEIKKLFPVDGVLISRQPKYKREAISDALAIYYTATKQSQIIRVLSNQTKENAPHQEQSRDRIPVREKTRKRNK